VEVTDGFSGSEDLAFDGKGHIVAKDGASVVKIDAAGTVTPFASLPGTVYGLRYSPSGDVVAAQPQAGKLVKISTAGDVSDFVTGLSGPNGVYVAADDSTYVTEFGAGRVIKIAPGMTSGVTIASGASLGAPNGVVFDPKRNLLFFTDYQGGILYSVDPAGGGTPTEVGQVNGAALDGLVLDACGNVYAVDQGGSRLYRFELDTSGALVGQPVLLADFPSNVANAQFGSGTGFTGTSLYAAGNPGVVFEVPVGVPGAPVPKEP
jgi:sugar lactone lactonase YvrE